MLINDCPFGQTFGTRGANVILPKFLEHCGANHSREDRGKRAAQSDRGKHQMPPRAGARDRKQSQSDRKEENQNRAESKIRERESKQAYKAQEAVIPAVAP